MAELNPEKDEKEKLTAAGCVLTLVSTAVIFGVAVPIVQWRDPETGQALPRNIAIVAPLLIGAAFHGIGTLLLRIVGLRVFDKPKKDDSNSAEESTKQQP